MTEGARGGDTPAVLGDARLDAEHAAFHQLADSLLHAEPAELMSVHEDLRRHARAHFESEDDDLRRLGGHNAQCHLDEHAAVLKSLDEVKGILINPAVTPDAKRQLVRRLAAQLLQWLPEHVMEMDTSVVAARDRVRRGGSRVQMPVPRRPAVGGR